jgi:hypothetical protein
MTLPAEIHSAAYIFHRMCNGALNGVYRNIDKRLFDNLRWGSTRIKNRRKCTVPGSWYRKLHD